MGHPRIITDLHSGFMYTFTVTLRLDNNNNHTKNHVKSQRSKVTLKILLKVDWGTLICT